MKKQTLFLLLWAGLSAFSSLSAQTGTRYYKQAFGGRLGFIGKHQVYSDMDFAAFSYKNFFTPKSAFEINLGWGAAPAGATQTIHSFSLSASYQLHFPIANTGLRPFAGGGAAAIYSRAEKSVYRGEVNRLLPAIYPIIGIDYESGRRFNIAADLRPMFIFSNEANEQSGRRTAFAPYAGLSFRRTF